VRAEVGGGMGSGNSSGGNLKIHLGGMRNWNEAGMVGEDVALLRQSLGGREGFGVGVVVVGGGRGGECRVSECFDSEDISPIFVLKEEKSRITRNFVIAAVSVTQRKKTHLQLLSAV
jgi:hypothetical protein